jgi:hypothetical protein
VLSKSLKNVAAVKKGSKFQVAIEAVISEIRAGEYHLIVNDRDFSV